ncbi:MAG: 3-isopropylmalate dehydratase small subunit [Thalassobaculales bacterium]
MIEGRAWVFGDNIDTDVLAPGIYMKGPIETMARHCLESVDPAFAAGVRPGDIVVGGLNFGLGSSREQAAQVLTVLGVGAVLAASFARIFYRNALNLGLPVLFCPQARSIGAGDRLRVDPAAGRVDNLTRGTSLACDPIPPHLLAMIADGGLLPHLKKRIAAR